MAGVPYRWSEMEFDTPIPLLARKRIHGERMLVAQVHLTKGCIVPQHQHESEQMAIILSGRVRWTVAGKEVEMGTGEVLHLPSNVEHGLTALEDTDIIDVLSPPGPMGVDAHSG